MNLFKLKSTTSTHEFVPDVTHILIKNWTSENFKHWLMSEKYDQKTVIDVIMKQQLTGNAILCLTKEDLTEFKVPTGAAISIVAKLEALRQQQEDLLQQPQQPKLFSLSYPSTIQTTTEPSNSEMSNDHDQHDTSTTNPAVVPPYSSYPRTSPRPSLPKPPQTPTVLKPIHHDHRIDNEQDNIINHHTHSSTTATTPQVSPRNEDSTSSAKVSPRRDHHKPLPTIPQQGASSGSSSSITKTSSTTAPVPPVKRSSSVATNITTQGINNNNTRPEYWQQQQQPIDQYPKQQSPRLHQPPQKQPITTQRSSPTPIQDSKNMRTKKFVDAGFFPEDEL
ncbi:hypothetical protein FDP41_003637 [Naegleria fowleri]|uniref:SAM domain-containing protein n=1 Tax=Naegleria fowleri TaxID=5763 RepID=A0A6A5BWF8_NAEFO|nr:uncharacterized protein FDP41_003637 [Naegleria fowleri]KAF0977645.1 hypothetical protein FDP41_003637 [Naegleria fowleri]CAG4711865.1 unnamed protein product [Naegleria fowleri]